MYRALKTVLEDPRLFYGFIRLKLILSEFSYAQRAKYIGRAMTATPYNGSHEFLVWSEYAAMFPNLSKMQTLESSGMSLVKYFSLDVVLFLTTIFILLSLFVAKVLRIAGQCLYVERRKEIKKNQ